MGQTVTRCYRVEGMVCSACQAAVERATMRLPQVSSVHASASEGTLEVSYAGGVDADAAEGALFQAVFASGYEVAGGARAEKSQSARETERAGVSQPARSAMHAGTSQPAGSAMHAGASQAVESAACTEASQSAGSVTHAGTPQPARPTTHANTPQPAGSVVHAGESQAVESAAHAGSSQSAGPAACDKAPRSAMHATAPQPAGLAAHDALKSLLVLAAIGATLLLAHALGLTDVFLAFPTAGSATTYPALFVVGLFTSLHCVAMCGGLNLGQSLVYTTETRRPSGAAFSSGTAHKKKTLQALRPNALYNLGRLISYTAIGGLLGLLGSAFALSAQARAAIGVAAGAFMVAMGLTLMGILRPGVLSKLLPKKVVHKVASATATLRQRGPFLLGLVNGLMPCGPLQAMRVYAVATGSAAVGALSLFAFCLGTVPLMFVAGSVITALKARWRRGLMRIGGTMLVVFDLVAAGNGATLLGVNVSLPAQRGSDEVVAATGADGIRRATVEVDYGTYQDVRLKAGVPAELTFHVPEDKLIGCNSSLAIPAFGIQSDLATGDTVVSFDRVGNVGVSACSDRP